ncbi:hypothetical protein BSKO_12403 [Bryopsis sp. KO-2023]|nr:hypothetical protein BSKO_12403 [Bryopsis sp. KO-2023]
MPTASQLATPGRCVAVPQALATKSAISSGPARVRGSSSLGRNPAANAQLSSRAYHKGGSNFLAECPVRSGVRDVGSCVVRAESGEGKKTGTVMRLPIFPLGIVAMPATIVPLNIFEARYRVLFNTLLAGDEGLDEELIQKDSPFFGSRVFGMCMANKDGMRRVGTTLEIKQHTTIGDGKLLVTSRGIQRFSIVEVIEEKPVLICDVQLLEDNEEADPEQVTQLAEEVSEAYRSVLQLSWKLSNKKQEGKDDVLEPEELSLLSPSDLSFWVASLFANSEREQQELLEELSVTKRLQRELEILNGSLQYLRAKSALESVFKDDPTSMDPPQAGPPSN